MFVILISLLGFFLALYIGYAETRLGIGYAKRWSFSKAATGYSENRYRVRRNGVGYVRRQLWGTQKTM